MSPLPLPSGLTQLRRPPALLFGGEERQEAFPACIPAGCPPCFTRYSGQGAPRVPGRCPWPAPPAAAGAAPPSDSSPGARPDPVLLALLLSSRALCWLPAGSLCAWRLAGLAPGGGRGLWGDPTCTLGSPMIFPRCWTDMILCLQGSQPLVGEPKIGRLSLASLPGLHSEQIMQPLAIEACQEETPSTALVTTHLEISLPSSVPRTRDPEEDLLCIAKTFSYLRESGWYWGSITATEAKQQLLKMPEGTFLVRDSTHPSYLFTLSVKTNRGPTNVRIEYSDSKFRLDTNCLSKPRILAFPDVVSLVQHYVMSCTAENRSEASAQAVPPVPKETAAVHLKLIQPLKCKDRASSLQHLCRLRINHCVPPAAAGDLPLPRRMVEFLQQYPFQL